MPPAIAASNDALLAQELRAWLSQRRAALELEVRRYPTPIAACDLHLPALLEARSAVVQLLAVTDSTALAARFVAFAAHVDDPEAQRLGRRAAALAGPPPDAS